MKKILILLIIILFFYNNKEVNLCVLLSLDTWYKKLFPSIFPALMLSDLLLNSDIPNIFIKYFGSIFSKIFNINKPGLIVLIVSLLAGTPTNISIIKYYYDKKLINEYDVNKLIPMCLFFNPLFVVNNTSLKCYISIVLSSLLVGILLRNNHFEYIKFIPSKVNKFNLNKSVEKNIKILFSILGIVTIFMILSTILTIKKPIIDSIVSGTLEITTGLIKTNIFYKNNHYLYLFMLSFGGVSIYAQINSILNNIKLNYKYIYIFRFLTYIIAMFVYNM